MLFDLVSDLRYRVRAVFAKAAVERELDDEVRLHIDIETEQFVRAGYPLAEARRRALLAFGGVEQTKESTRDARGTSVLEHIVRDFGHAFRLARKQPGFTAVAVLSLALGIGATTAVFNLTYNLLFARLALPHPEQLVSLVRANANNDDRSDSFTWAEYRALREIPGIGSLAAMRGASVVSVTAGDRREFINMHFVDGSFFSMVGARPLSGRLITPQDDARQAPVVVLAEWFADRLFPAGVSPIGQTVIIRGVTFTVVGVTPRSFKGLEFPGWFTSAIPISTVSMLGGGGPGRDNRGIAFGMRDDRLGDARAFHIAGRLTAAPATARAALATAFAQCCGTTPGERLELVDIQRGIPGGKNDLRPGARMAMAILLGGMALLLVVVCCNIASLLLVRASARQREIAVRLALGASRARLVSQLVIENAPLALLGGVGGWCFAAWYTAIFLQSLPANWVDAADVGDILAFHANFALFGFTAALTVVCGIACALYPAFRATNQRLAQALRLDTRASRARGQGTVARSVVVAQVATTVVLVTAASLFGATLRNLGRVNPGIATDRVLMAGLEARSTRYERTGVAPVLDEIMRRVRSVPGVRAATAATFIPLFGGNNTDLVISRDGAPSANEPPTNLILTMPGYFGASETRLVAGREFTAADGAQSDMVAIVSREFARRYFGDRDPIGGSLNVRLRDNELTTLRIIGVATDAAYDDLRAAPQAVLYMPLAQSPGKLDGLPLLIRTEGEPMAVARSVARAIEAAAPGMSVRRMRDMRAQLDEAMALERLAGRLAAFVSLMALVLAAVGLYGVVAYSVSRRTSEIGIRVALGARSRAVLWLVSKETIALVGIGLLVGIPLSFATNAALRSQLFGVGARDPIAAGLAIVLLGAAGLVASILPARRATRIDPRIALNAD